MYKIYADDELIYDSTNEKYKIGKGSVGRENNKSGSFNFSLYPEHFYYDNIVKMKTVIKVCKRDKIIFRGRVLNDDIDHWNIKNIVCEGELGFFQDSVIRPFDFSGTPEELFTKFITEHNSQVDAFKHFKIGKVTVTDPNNYTVRENTAYESALNNLDKRCFNSELGGYLHISHDTEDDIPTISWLADFEHTSSQPIEFGSNLKQFTKKTTASDIATAIIPLGAEVEAEDSTKSKLNIKSVNNGLDYVYDAEAVALRGWLIKPIDFSDVTDANNLKRKGEEYLQSVINQAITIELTAIDLSLLNKSIESYNVGDYIPVSSAPHNFNMTMLCTKQTIDLLNPANDTVTLGHSFSSFTEKSGKVTTAINTISTIQKSVDKAIATVTKANQSAESMVNDYNDIKNGLNTVSGDTQAIASAVTLNAQNIAQNAQNISANAGAIEDIIARLIILENKEV